MEVTLSSNCRRASTPTTNFPFTLLKATTEGVVLPPKRFSKTLGLPPSIMATQELVVPRSIPNIGPLFKFSLLTSLLIYIINFIFYIFRLYLFYYLWNLLIILLIIIFALSTNHHLSRTKNLVI